MFILSKISKANFPIKSIYQSFNYFNQFHISLYNSQEENFLNIKKKNIKKEILIINIKY